MTPWTVASQAPLSMEFSRQEYWSTLPFPTPGDLPSPGIAPRSAASLELVGRFFTASATWEAHYKLQSPCFTLGLQTFIYLMTGSLYPLTKPFLFLPPLQLLATTFLLSVSEFNFFILYTWVRSYSVCLYLFDAFLSIF